MKKVVGEILRPFVIIRTIKQKKLDSKRGN